MSMNDEVYLLPASYGQNRMWFFEKMFPNSPTYNIPFIFKMKGPLNHKALEHALWRVMQRHEVFRTTFCEVEGQPVQRVASHPASFSLKAVKVEEILKNVAFNDYLEVFAKRLLPLERGPLINIELIEMQENLHYLLVNVHHIIFDAWSIDVFKKELYLSYVGYCKKTDQLEELEFHYADFAQWEKDIIDEMEDSGKLHSWKDYLKDAPSALAVSPDYSRPKTPSYRGENFKFKIPEELVAKVRSFSQYNGLTLNSLFMTVFNVLLYRYTGQKDIVIGTPVSNRKEYFTQDLIGFFVNIIPVRTLVKPYSNIKEMLKATLQSFLKGYENSEIPFERIVQEVNPERESTYHPLFQVLFTYHERQVGIKLESSLIIEHEKINTHTSKFDLAFYVSTDEKSGDGEIEYNPDLYHPQTMERFAQHFIALLNEVIDHPEKPISKLTFLTSEEQKEHVQNKWESTASNYIPELFKQQLFEKSKALAVKGPQVSYTYEDLNSRANQVANAIIDMSIPTGSIVGIRMKRSPDQIASILGVLKSGCAYLPIDPATPVNRIQYILEDSKAAMLVTDDEVESDFLSPQLSFNKINECKTDEPALDWKDQFSPSELTAYVIYTSGSTGKPKGVSITHASLVNHIASYLEAFPMEEGERMLQNITFSFDASITEIFGSLLSGTALILTRQEGQFDVDYLAGVISEEHVTRAQLFHSLIEKLIEIPIFQQCRSLRRVFTGGEPLSYQLVHRFYEAMEGPSDFINLYGPTEATVAATFHVCEKNSVHSSVPIGKPFKGYTLGVFDENLQPAPRGVEGELFIGGPGVAKEYLNNEELSKRSFLTFEINEQQGRYYRTGDIVRQSQDGSFRFVSRKDTQVKIRGFRIELNEVRNVLMGMEQIDEAAVIAEEHLGDKKLFCFIVKNKQSFSAKDVKLYLMQELPYYMVPSVITFVDKIPRSSNGKLLKDQLPLHLNDLIAEEKQNARNKIDKILISIWEDVLGSRPIGINEDFFDIGGHSIKAIELVGAIRKRLGREVPLSILFEYRNVELMSDWLQTQDDKPPANLIIPLKKKKSSGSPLFLVHPGGGGVLCYVKLAEALKLDTSVYGIQSVGYDKAELPLIDIMNMATRYVIDLKKIQPFGPYRLAGWSMGGTLAVEMARILENEGEELSFIGLLDAYPFQQSTVQIQQRNPLYVWARTFGLDLSQFDNLSKTRQYKVILDGAKERGILPLSSELQDVERIIAVMGANNLACGTYRFTEPIRSDLHLFRCSELDPVHPHLLISEELWSFRTTGSVHTIEIGGHHNNIMESPQVEKLAEEMNKIMTGKEALALCR
ncbi:non-ribosomal peptide synthetase [Peribacillus frigoritolerans]|uniref:non-ribosomal peptide synthetase n=1 Tax=Peribacillus frigoritolerans TaxID=450367 RepID=UPI0023DB750D|nr:non-ribosomal peptide synthetase [Peribacillus frigoritolerans]MDF1999858.1 amino acid adenylation domain-containing protein [Peribacillus frigoritolerans]